MKSNAKHARFIKLRIKTLILVYNVTILFEAPFIIYVSSAARGKVW